MDDTFRPVKSVFGVHLIGERFFKAIAAVAAVVLFAFFEFVGMDAIFAVLDDMEARREDLGSGKFS